MEKVHRKISYIEGLVEGADLNHTSKEGKVIHELIELCKLMAKQLDQLKLQVEDQETFIEAVDEDLADIEEILFDDDVEFENEETNLEDALEEDNNIGYFEIQCPHCEEMVLVDQDIFGTDAEVEVTCPECSNSFSINDEVPIITRHIFNMENNTSEAHYYSP